MNVSSPSLQEVMRGRKIPASAKPQWLLRNREDWGLRLMHTCSTSTERSLFPSRRGPPRPFSYLSVDKLSSQKITKKTKFNKKFKRLIERSVGYNEEKKQKKSYKTGVIKLDTPKEDDYVSMQDLIEVKRLKKYDA
jgi:hypothetical protein